MSYVWDEFGRHWWLSFASEQDALHAFMYEDVQLACVNGFYNAVKLDYCL